MKLLDNLYTIISQDVDNDKQKFMLRLNPEHEIYKCHFPGNPITPGVCILQMLTELAEIALERGLSVKGYSNVKYLSVISPIENPEITVEFSYVDGDEGVKLKAVVYNDNASFAKISAQLI